MQQPRLIIVAGCNGSGKSTYSQLIVGDQIIPFDYDVRFAKYYKSLPDSEFRMQFAINKTTEELENLIQMSFKNKTSFCFETNLMTFPLIWLQEAKKLGFKIEIFFFCLIDVEKAKERVLIRAKNDGHFVEDNIVEIKWKEGYKNINKFYHLADSIVFIDNSKDDSIPEFLFELIKTAESEFEIIVHNDIPDYTARRLPSIFGLLK